MLRIVLYRKIALWLILLLILSSCGNKSSNNQDTRKQYINKKGLLVKRTFYEEEGKEANVLTERTFKVRNDDTIPHGYAKSFYQNGQLMGEEHYKNGTQVGVFQQFYSDGTVNQKGWMVDGKLDSTGLMFYSDGQLEAKTHWKYGKQIGEQLHYHRNGKLQIYSFYNPGGEAIYGRKYNENGQLINEKGRQTPQILYKGEDAELTPGETLHVTIYAPTPPDCKVDLQLSITGNNGQVIVDSQEVVLNNGKAVYKKELKKPGQYKFKTSLLFKDLKSDETRTFENAFEYEVVKE